MSLPDKSLENTLLHLPLLSEAMGFTLLDRRLYVFGQSAGLWARWETRKEMLLDALQRIEELALAGALCHPDEPLVLLELPRRSLINVLNASCARCSDYLYTKSLCKKARQQKLMKELSRQGLPWREGACCIDRRGPCCRFVDHDRSNAALAVEELALDNSYHSDLHQRGRQGDRQRARPSLLTLLLTPTALAVANGLPMGRWLQWTYGPTGFRRGRAVQVRICTNATPVIEPDLSIGRVLNICKPLYILRRHASDDFCSCSWPGACSLIDVLDVEPKKLDFLASSAFLPLPFGLRILA